MKTINGGSDWEEKYYEPTHLSLSSIFFTDVNTGYFIGMGNTVRKTIDGGCSWIIQASGISDSIPSLTEVYFPTADTGYIVGANGVILKTTNGGGFPVGYYDFRQTIQAFSVYPNPASNTITIETPAKGFLYILNISGQQLLQQEITEPITTIDVSTLQNGIYIVKLVAANGVQVRKFIKK
jgi:hypothetical protein